MYRKGNGGFYLTHFERYKTSGYDTSKCHIDDVRNEALPLHVAIANRKKMSVIKNYLDMGQINSIDGARNSCLHVAVSVAPYDLEVIQELLKRNANINAKNWNGDTPLHVAASHPQCDVDLIQLLIKNGADLNTTNNFCESPLYSFLRKCDDAENFDRYFSIFKLLLDSGANPNVRNISQSYPVMTAITFSNFSKLPIIKELVKHGADLSLRSGEEESTLHKAVIDGTSKYSFLFRKASPDDPEYKLKLVKFIVKNYRCNINDRNKKGYTPLHVAVMRNVSSDVVKELIINGANVNSTDSERNTPLHLARTTPYSVLATLVKYQADINALNQNNRTPLIEIIMNKSEDVDSTTVAAFLELGARPNVVDVTNCTALHHALSNKNASTDVVRLLLENGADPLNTNFDHMPPLYFCSENEDTAKIYILYVIFNIFWVKMDIKKPFKELMEFTLYSQRLNKTFSKYRDDCASEIIQMNKDNLTNKITVLDYLYRTCSWRVTETYPYSFVKEILDRVYSNTYPCCKDLLRASLKKDKLIPYFLTLFVHITVSKSSGVEQTIVLNYEIKKNLVEYLDRDSLFNLVQAYDGPKPKNVQKPTPRFSYNLRRSGTKRKYTE